MVINLKIVGTIVEYNPLHNGHAYAISKIKSETQADVIIAVMSGDFTMRGELSLFNKFEKTYQALNIGIDLVIELPFPYTVQNSDLFAKHAVTLLNLAKVNEIWIGSYQGLYRYNMDSERIKHYTHTSASTRSLCSSTAIVCVRHSGTPPVLIACLGMCVRNATLSSTCEPPTPPN